jgi:O-antigen biosynthesis protein
MSQRGRKKVILMLGSVWPEITSSAAGLREWNLINTFLKYDYHVIYSSAAKENQFTKDLKSSGLETYNFQSNDSKFNDWISELKPNFVIFDRYIIEEQFGWRVSTSSPSTIRILDTQDLHFLRIARHNYLLQNSLPCSPSSLLPSSLQSIFNAQIPLQENDYCYRELSSIYRCDLTLILSSFELSLLTSQPFHLPSSLLHLSPFHYPKPNLTNLGTANSNFQTRQHFCMIGNFRHPPNADGVKWLSSEIWPRIHKVLPHTEMHVYGAYPSREMMDLTNPLKGFHVKGPVKDHFKMLRKYKVNCAPLRFGAGIKGKITDGWFCGTPVVTTPIGSEGMMGQEEPARGVTEGEGGEGEAKAEDDQEGWGGEISSSDPQDFANKAVELYLNEKKWQAAQHNGYRILNTFHSEEVNSLSLAQQLTRLEESIAERRRENRKELYGSLLNFNSMRATKYFSLWIEEKNKLKSQ